MNKKSVKLMIPAAARQSFWRSLGCFCPKCKREYLVNVKQFKTQIVNEPDAKTQS